VALAALDVRWAEIERELARRSEPGMPRRRRGGDR
jgi:hypothetical protein